MCLIVEYASYGNLRDFLRQCEEVVLSLNHLPHIPRNRSANLYTPSPALPPSLPHSLPPSPPPSLTPSLPPSPPPPLPHLLRSRTRTLSASSCSSGQPLISRQDSVFTPGSGHTHFVFPSPTGHASSGSTGSDGGVKMAAHHPSATALPLAHTVAPIGHDYINTKGLVYMEDVRNFALQIACGLQHLASMQV